MLRNARELLGCAIHAVDGDIGHINDLYFDDEKWGIRYLVVGTGHWLAVHNVLISPIACGEVNWRAHKLNVNLTCDQVADSPNMETHQPVSRQWETQYYEYYRWPLYWIGASLWGSLAYPSLLATADPIVTMENLEDAHGATGDATHDSGGAPSGAASVAAASVTTAPAAAAAPSPEPDNGAALQSDDLHLQSLQDVMGYHIEAEDGGIGHVVDFILDDHTWAIRYLEVDTRNWWPGKKVLIAPQWIHRVRWPESVVYVDLPTEVIKNSPEYNPELPVSEEYEARLSDYYVTARLDTLQAEPEPEPDSEPEPEPEPETAP